MKARPTPGAKAWPWATKIEFKIPLLILSPHFANAFVMGAG